MQSAQPRERPLVSLTPRTEGKKNVSHSDIEKLASQCALGLPRSLARCLAQKNYDVPFDTLKQGPATWEYRSWTALDLCQDPATGRQQQKVPV